MEVRENPITINKKNEFFVTFYVEQGKIIDKMTVNVYQRNKQLDLVEQHVTKVPRMPGGKLRQELLVRAFLTFERKNSFGLKIV